MSGPELYSVVPVARMSGANAGWFYSLHVTPDCAALISPALRVHSGRPLLTLDLSAVHDAPAVAVERIAPMHGTAIVPKNEVADAPGVLPGKAGIVHETPQLVEQRFRLRKRKAYEIGIAAAAEVKHAPAGYRARANERVHCTRRGGGIIGWCY